MASHIVRVSLGQRSYDILIGAGLLEQSGSAIKRVLQRPRVAIVADARVAKLHLPSLIGPLSNAGVDCVVKQLPGGETTKSWEVLRSTVEWMLSMQIERGDTVVAFGGGVVGDLAGFAAAILRRGVDCIQIPTTLLAQVDSAVGGKTGINSKAGKNLIGAFHQPRLVLADIDLLRTLPKRDFIAGVGEVAKYGLISDHVFFEWLEQTGRRFNTDNTKALTQAVQRSCEIKASLVETDETEHGTRSLLNLGHTFGHALETATGYSSRMLHGEAVAIGCCLAFDTSERLGLCSSADNRRVAQYFQSMGMKTRISEIEGPVPSPHDLLRLMGQDKKVIDGKLRFVLANGIGKAFVSEKDVTDCVAESLAASHRDQS